MPQTIAYLLIQQNPDGSTWGNVVPYSTIASLLAGIPVAGPLLATAQAQAAVGLGVVSVLVMEPSLITVLAGQQPQLGPAFVIDGDVNGLVSIGGR